MKIEGLTIMKVLHVLNTSTFSGAENVVCQIIKLFENTDISMAYCSREGSIKDKLNEYGIRYYSLHDMSCKEIERVILEYKPDIIHAHDMRATYFSCKNKMNIPVISHIHNNAYDSRKLSKKSIAFYLISRKVKHIFWVSEEALSQFVFSKMVQKKSSVLNNVISWKLLNEKLTMDDNTYTYDVIYLGRLSEEKNPIRFIDIVERVYNQIPALKVAIVGDGKLREQVENYIREKNLSNCIDMLGFMSNPLKVLKDSKCLVMTSLREGLPMSAIESQMVGTPIICTPVGALPQIVENDYTGYLCEENREFENSITSIICDINNYQRLSNNSIKFAREFNDPKVFMNKLIAQYRCIS